MSNALRLSDDEWAVYMATTQEHGTVRWFGPDWHAPVCKPETHIDVPVGISCEVCDQPIEPDQRGMAIPSLSGGKLTLVCYHQGCWLETILGPDYREHFPMISDGTYRVQANDE